VDLEHGALPDPVVRAISESLDRQGRLEERVRELETALARLAREAIGAAQPRRLLADAELVQRVREAVSEVLDPEVGVSLMQLGFVRDVLLNGEDVEVRLSLDDPRCPMMEYFVDQIRRKVKSVNGIQRVEVTLLDSPASPVEAKASELMQEGVHHG
jgi:serine O-acetyltransferase